MAKAAKKGGENDKNNVVTLFDPNTGEAKRYKLFSARLPEFLKEYSADKGYSITFEHTDALSERPVMAKLFEIALTQGKKPEDVGLPPIPVTMVFTAVLKKDDKIIQTASANYPILQYKHYERGETAAFQRLLALRGYDGGMLDEDEREDMKEQKLDTTGGEGGNAQPAGNGGNSAGEGGEQAGGAGEQKHTPAGGGNDGGAGSKSDKGGKTEPAGESAGESNTEIPKFLTRQLENLARQKGVEVPVVKTEEEARAKIKELMNKDK